MESAPKQEGHHPTKRGLGLPATTPPDVVVAAATEVENSGYHSFWLNNPPQADALMTLGRVAQAVPRLWLGVGVIPLSAHEPAQIVLGVRDNALPLDRCYLGIGSGSGAGGVQRVAQGVGALRSSLHCQLVVAALGPRMCRLAGAVADAVLFNWLIPDYAVTSIQWVRESAQEAGRPMPRLMAYVRAALGEEGIRRLQGEAQTYERIPAYADHFQRMGVGAMATAVTGKDAEDIRHGLSAWDGVIDEVVVRAVAATDTVEEVSRLVQAARPTT
jgi:alkanesulfonate monooxygenase SsuD/methylene tetrahydromethanopterin reductase-like flavin-dependent oxidoreductase (luciferase family)